jgi:hypothetical protein
MKLNRLLSSLWVTSTLLLSSAHAAVIDFEDVTVGNCMESSPVLSGGFSFSSTGGHCVTNHAQDPDIPDSGSNFLVDGDTFVSALTGDLFSVLSLQLATSFLNTDLPNFLTVTGEFADGTTIDQRLELGDTFQPYALIGFTDLVSLSISPLEQGVGYYGLDNLVIADGTPDPDPNPVPLPATLPLMGLGLAALAAVRRRMN